MTPRGYIAVGLCMDVLGGMALSIATSGVGLAWLFAVVLLALGTAAALVGLIGEGVRLGMQTVADDERRALRRAQELV